MKKIDKIKNWANDHFEEILMAGMGIGGIVAGYILGQGYGYTKGLVEFRKEHCDLVEKAVNVAGCQSCFLTLDKVNEHINEIINAYENSEYPYNDIIKEVNDKFYEIEDIKQILESTKDV